MKKLSIYFLVIMCLFITGCGNNKKKDIISLNDFDKILTDNGFTVSDNMNNYSSVDYIVEAKIAVMDDIEIEMVKYTTNDYATAVQDNQIESFNLLKSTGAHEDKEKGSNYYKYVLVSNNRYMINSRVDNTLVFCKTLLENKEKVEKVYSILGY